MTSTLRSHGPFQAQNGTDSGADHNLRIHPSQPWLAPLAGFSDLPFRLLCREFGCKVACTEMVSAKGLVYRSPGTVDLVRTCPEDQALVVQLFGAEADFLGEALDILLNQGLRYFDLNAGCPVKKVVKTGAGGGLLRTWDHLLKLASLMVERVGPGRVGIKVRAGWSSPEEILEHVDTFQDMGLGWLTLHPRTVTQGYSGRANWDVLAAVCKRLHLPVLASGDLFTAEDGHRCLHQTGASGLMFARGALADPGIFRSFMQGDSAWDRQEVSAPIRAVHMAKRHIHLTQEYGESSNGLLKMRTIIPRYLRGFQGVKEIRCRVVACTSWEELLQCLSAIESDTRGL